MTTIYLTQCQYQMVLDGQICTHLDKLDCNNDGVLTVNGDQFTKTEHSSLNGGNGYINGWSELADDDESWEAMSDISVIGLTDNDQNVGVADEVWESDGLLYGYNLEQLNKIIDAYNNGLSVGDDNYDDIVYEGVGATGKAAPDSVYDSLKSITNLSLNWGNIDTTSLSELAAANDIDESDIADYTTDSAGNITSITLKSDGQTYYANITSSDDVNEAIWIKELQNAGATDFQYFSDGTLAGYTLNGKVYKMSEEASGFGEASANEARTAELLAELDAISGKISSTEAEKAELEAEKEVQEEEAAEQEEKVAATKKEIETQQKEAEEETQEYKEVAFDLDDINAALEEEVELEKASAGKDSSTSKKSSLNSKVSDLTSKLSSIAKNIKFTNFNIDATESVLDSETKTLDNINTGITDLDTQISAKDATITDLQAQYDAKLAEKAALE